MRCLAQNNIEAVAKHIPMLKARRRPFLTALSVGENGQKDGRRSEIICLVNIRCLQSGQPLPAKSLAIWLTGALPFVPDIPARNFCGSQVFLQIRGAKCPARRCPAAAGATRLRASRPYKYLKYKYFYDLPWTAEATMSAFGPPNGHRHVVDPIDAI